MTDQTPLPLRETAYFSTVFDRYFGSLCLYARYILQNPEDAEDVVTTFFVKLWDGGQEFRDEEHLKAYLYRGVKNESLKLLRDQTRHNEGQARLLAQREQTEQGHVHEIIKREVVRTLHEAIAGLRADEQHIIRLAYLEGKTNREIAEQLGLALQTIKNKKLRALAVLRKRLTKEQFSLLLLFPQLLWGG